MRPKYGGKRRLMEGLELMVLSSDEEGLNESMERPHTSRPLNNNNPLNITSTYVFGVLGLKFSAHD